jgi:molecular chaperone HtpG
LVPEELLSCPLNVDYPLTGILYFPKLGSDLQIQKDKIQLYQNQVYVTDNEGIVPEFLDAKRCYRFSRYSIECISFWITSRCGGKDSNYITRKVADKLKSLFGKP